eukprot:Transcript_7334.p1 GENE.Transcript_7334~~Transcript_7334.p1  ORF type:complete len:155 (-),score=9.97 Transcript_7334:506-970(-)
MNTSTLPPSSPWPAPPAPPWAPPDPDAEDWALGLRMMIPMGVCLVLCCFCWMFILKAIDSGIGFVPQILAFVGLAFMCFMVGVLSLAAAAVVLGAQGRGPEPMLIFGSVTLALSALTVLLLPFVLYWGIHPECWSRVFYGRRRPEKGNEAIERT